MLSTAHVAGLRILSDQIAEKKLTQQQIALATGVHQSQISRILAGKASRPSRNILKLCKYADALPRSPRAADGSAIEAATVLGKFIGGSESEQQAFATVLASLRAWRHTWDSNR